MNVTTFYFDAPRLRASTKVMMCSTAAQIDANALMIDVAREVRSGHAR
jgi:hypothetical protein